MIGVGKRADVEKKLDILTDSAVYDVCMASCNSNPGGGFGRLRDPKDPINRWVYPARIPGRGQVTILKVLQTNVCRNSCSYCIFSSKRDSIERVGFAPQELADVFFSLYQKFRLHGIFLSSGVGLNPDITMSRMLATAEILRKRYRFNGYIHLKVLPGASFHLVEHATALADRVSINLEAPTPEHLKRVAPDKDFVEDLLKRMKWVGSLIRNSSYAKSHTTQFVVGSSDESDLEILKTVDWIYRELYLFRAYFSAFQPVEESSCLLPRETSPLDRNQSLLREHRLYQSDFLLRGYGFRLHDLVFDSQGQLPSGVDPKTAYAIMHPEFYPVDINRASEQELLKVPGIGPLSARRIVETRVQDTFRSLSELRRVGAFVNRAAPYLEFSGRAERSSETDYTQRWLFERARPEDWRTGFEPYQKEK